MMNQSKTITAGMVAEKLGYPNVQYFSGIFKKITGVVPSDYKLAQNSMQFGGFA